MSNFIVPAPQFHVVFVLRYEAEDFSVEGFFSKLEDAQQLASELRAAGSMKRVVDPLKMSMQDLMDRLAADRLGALAEQFECLKKVL